MTNIQISPIESPAIHEILTISERELGAFYITPEKLPIGSPTSLCASIGDEVVGFCLAEEIDRSRLLDDYTEIAALRIPELVEADKVGLIASIAVADHLQGRGIGKRLMQASLQALKAAGTNVVIMRGWKSSLGVRIQGIAESLGFTELTEVAQHWHQDSIENGYICPDCGAPPCDCSAVFFMKTL